MVRKKLSREGQLFCVVRRPVAGRCYLIQMGSASQPNVAAIAVTISAGVMIDDQYSLLQEEVGRYVQPL